MTFISENTIIKTVRAESTSTIAYPNNPTKSGYYFSGWKGIPDVLTGDVTAEAVFLKICKVDFYINETDQEAYATKTVVEGNAVELPNPPTKKDTKEATFTFKGWKGDLTNVSSDMKVYAEFDEHKISYSYSFYNYDGKLIKKGSGYYLSKVEIPVAERAADENFIYVLDGYDLVGNGLTEDGIVDEIPTELEYSFTAKAIFSPKPRAFVVNFYNGEELIDTLSVEYGNAANTDVLPEKAADEHYTYVFSGWDKDIDEITSDLDVYAEFEPCKRQYSYKFITYAGVVVKEGTVDFDAEIIPPEDDYKPSDSQYEYIFTGWNGYEQGQELSEDVEFTATFENKLRTYGYRFIFNNAVYSSGELEYGKEIPLPEDPVAPDGFVFDGWSGYSDGTKIESNCEFRAKINA